MSLIEKDTNIHKEKYEKKFIAKFFYNQKEI